MRKEALEGTAKNCIYGIVESYLAVIFAVFIQVDDGKSVRMEANGMRTIEHGQFLTILLVLNKHFINLEVSDNLQRSL